MEITEFTLKLLFLFLPGIVAFIIAEQLTTHEEIKLYNKILYSFILGVVCYFLYYLLTQKEVLNICNVSDNNGIINYQEIFYVSLIAIPLGFILSGFLNYKILHRFARAIRLTNKY